MKSPQITISAWRLLDIAIAKIDKLKARRRELLEMADTARAEKIERKRQEILDSFPYKILKKIGVMNESHVTPESVCQLWFFNPSDKDAVSKYLEYYWSSLKEQEALEEIIKFIRSPEVSMDDTLTVNIEVIS